MNRKSFFKSSLAAIGAFFATPFLAKSNDAPNSKFLPNQPWPEEMFEEAKENVLNSYTENNPKYKDLWTFHTHMHMQDWENFKEVDTKPVNYQIYGNSEELLRKIVRQAASLIAKAEIGKHKTPEENWANRTKELMLSINNEPQYYWTQEVPGGLPTKHKI